MLGVTKRIALWRCSQLYQLGQDFTQASAVAFDAKPLLGQSGRYLQVRNSASENGLSWLIGSYGAGLSRDLLAKGHTVLEVMRPNRQLRYLHGKSDSPNAEGTARSVLESV